MVQVMEEFLEHIDYGVFVVAVSPQFHFVAANSNCLGILNSEFLREDVNGLKPEELLPIASAQRLINNCDRALKTQKKVEYEEILKFPEPSNHSRRTVAIAIHLSPVILNKEVQSEDKIEQIIGTIHNLSHKRLAQLNRELFTSMVGNDSDALSDAVIVVDRDGVVRFVNHAAEILFNREAQELEGQQFGLPIVSGERTEVNILRRDGRFTPAEMKVSETQGEDEIVYIVASLKDISVRKLAEKSSRLRDRALAASSNGILISDAKQSDNPIIYTNASFERITGYSSAEVVGSNCRFLQGSDRSQEGIATMREAVKNGQPCYTVLRNYRKDGTLFWVELWISPVYNDLGELTNFIGIQNDITSRILDAKEKNENEEILRTVLTAVKEGITFSDEQGKFVIFNQEMENLTGYTITEAKACSSFMNLIHPHDQELAIAQIEKLRQSHLPVESEVKVHTKSGVVKNVLVSTSLVMLKGKVMYLSAYRDITERKVAEEKLRQTMERERLIGAIALRIRKSLDLTDILQNTVNEVRGMLNSDRVLIYQFEKTLKGRIVVESLVSPELGTLGKEVNDDCFRQDYLIEHPQGRVTVINDVDTSNLDPCHREFLQSFGVRANLVVPINFIDRVWGLLIAHQCHDDRAWKEDEITLLTGLAEQVAIGIRQAELLNREQTLNMDLEQLVEERTSKLRQALVKEKELGEMKSRFVSMASHEFRTPLSIIQTSSDLLKFYSHKLSESKRIEKLDKIQKEVKNMTELLEDVLTIGKIELRKLDLKLVPVDLDKFCQETIEEFNSALSSGHQIKFTVKNPQGNKPANILIDPKLMRQVIVNLLSNSIKYSAPNNALNTEFNSEAVQVNLQYDFDGFDLEFIDHGIGIPLQDQPRIFESFQRAHNVGNIPGTGLGLAIAKTSVDLHKGEIKVCSQVNVGTTITITIPYQ